MIIYPAVDILGSRCARLTQGDYKQVKVYYEDPVEPALRWKVCGAEWLHVIDLDGAKAGEPVNADIVRAIVDATGLKVQCGGGIRDAGHAARMAEAGVSRFIIGTRAVESPEFVRVLCREYGDKVCVSIDARDGFVAMAGWLDTAGIRAADLAADVASWGVETIIYTDIASDGMLKGPNLTAIEALLAAVPGLSVIAAGGVTTIDDVRALTAFADKGLSGIIIGKALYEKTIDLKEALNAGKAYNSLS